ncbi:FTR1 family iron permease [Limnobacter litoralis]|uniref:Transport-related membrane protein n=1 Tax=Limnobacter litoralis TaxID=481366 RepID=A0ABQ5YMY0_9BURK|nr:FTR1 family protein [Limnobacter litoralis]GLR25454.1 transport-related membrane protein [Limnobacter litoralis]
MLAAAIILFRETLEAALILGIVAAATRGVFGRGRALWMGVGLGLVGSVLLAAVMGQLANMADGLGQELFNAMVLGIAVCMLAWHHIWMRSHGAELAGQAKKVGAGVRDGAVGLSAIVVLIALTVLREGAESVMFLQGISSASDQGPVQMLMGAFAGILTGGILGCLLYAGLVKIPLKWFFSVTGVLLVLLAAGLSSQMARFLVQADLLPTLVTPLWDTSWLLSLDSLPGAMLHVLVGYDPEPSGIQVVFYLATALAIVVAARWVQGTSRTANQAAV